MRKLPLFLTSLISAVPGAFLVYLFVQFLLNHWSGASGGLQALTVVAALVGVVMAALPVVILVTVKEPGSSKKKADKKDAEVDELGADAIAAEDTFEAGSSELEVTESGELEAMEAVDSGEVEMADSDELIMEDSGELTMGDSDEMLMADSGEFEDISEEPSSKKKKS